MCHDDYISKWKEINEKGVLELDEVFSRIFSGLSEVPSFYHPILYKFNKNIQLKHWNKDIYQFSKGKIDNMNEILGEDKMELLVYENLNKIIDIYENLLDVEQQIVLMERFKGSEKLRVKMFSKDIFNELVNNAYTNTLKLFIEFQSVVEEKNLRQKTLTPMIECLSSRKRGYVKITDLVDTNIRNSISHGGVKVEESQINFTYRDKNLCQDTTMTLPIYDFKTYILQMIDGIGGVFLAWLELVINKIPSFSHIRKDLNIQEATSTFFSKLYLSTLLISCESIQNQNINRQDKNYLQVNVMITSPDIEIDTRMKIGLTLATRIFQIKKLQLKDKVMVTFKSTRTVTSFLIMEGQLISDLSQGLIDIDEAKEKVQNSNQSMMSPINTDAINEFDDLFRYYSDIDDDDFYITELEDISISNVKRLKATGYIKRGYRKSHVKTSAVQMINKLKILENRGFVSHKVKHGIMEADIVYLTLYRKEARSGKERVIQSSNENFIVQIQYDKNMEFPIRNRLIDGNLKRKRERNIEYQWNPNF